MIHWMAFMCAPIQLKYTHNLSLCARTAHKQAAIKTD